jgi:penicillin-binding protein 1B
MAHVGMAIGPETVVATLHQLGLQKDISPYPSILLGGFNLTPLQVAMLYQPLANGGFQTPLRSITDVLDKDGKPLARYPAASNQVLSADRDYLVSWAMQQVVAKGTGRYAGERLPDLHLAGKTGTSNDLRDSWFAGFSGSSLAVVWIGRDDNGNTGMTGSSGALHVWEPLMAKVPQQPLVLTTPADVEMVWVNPDGVRLSGPACPGSMQYPLLKSSMPAQSDGCGKVEKTGKGVVQWVKKLFSW